MNTIREDWKSYREVLHPQAGPIQITETRRAFYAGAWSVLALCVTAIKSGDPAQTFADIDGWMRECVAFRDAVYGGTEDAFDAEP
jgi:hypothetical protein